MGRNFKLERLQNGETFVTSEKGNSMVPRIRSGQKHIIEPVDIADVEVDDVVYCKVRGTYYTHLVKALHDKKGCLIGNNHGGINGWTRQVFGRVKEVL